MKKIFEGVSYSFFLVRFYVQDPIYAAAPFFIFFLLGRTPNLKNLATPMIKIR